MKSIHLFLLAGAAVMLTAVSCAKTETIHDETPAEIGFKAAATKADPELAGASLGTDNDYVIYAAASADGSPKYFDPAATSYAASCSPISRTAPSGSRPAATPIPSSISIGLSAA